MALLAPVPPARPESPEAAALVAEPLTRHVVREGDKLGAADAYPLRLDTTVAGGVAGLAGVGAAAAAASGPDPRLRQVPVAAVVAARGALPRERVPLKVLVTGAVPRDGYGKLRRHEVPGLSG